MPLKNSATRWGSVSMGLHWLVDRHYWGGPQLVVLILGCMLTACALCLIAQP